MCINLKIRSLKPKINFYILKPKFKNQIFLQNNFRFFKFQKLFDIKFKQIDVVGMKHSYLYFSIHFNKLQNIFQLQKKLFCIEIFYKNTTRIVNTIA